MTESLIALVALSLMEIVLGIDNIVFITILAGKLPEAQRRLATRLGLAAALITRLLLLFTLSWVMRLSTPMFTLVGHEVTGRDLVLILGGLFLVAKATLEIYEKVEAVHPKDGTRAEAGRGQLASIIFQIMLLDIVFSLDSVITAVGMTNMIGVMVAAVMIAITVMLLAAGPISAFVERHLTVKMLALSFLLLIGVTLIAEGLDLHIPKGYIYFAMGFSVFVEMINLRARRHRRGLEPIPDWRIQKLQQIVPGDYTVPQKAYIWSLQNPHISAVISDLWDENYVTENLFAAGKRVDLELA